MIAVVAWKSQQGFLTWFGLRRHQILKAKYAVSFRLIHLSHDVLCSLNEGPQHHVTQQVLSLILKLGYDLVNAGVTHTCNNGQNCLGQHLAGRMQHKAAASRIIKRHLAGSVAALLELLQDIRLKLS